MHRLITTVRTWGEMIKFSHSVFALPFALLATFLAARPQRPTLAQLGLIVLCMVAARSAAMTFNRIADRFLDAANPRTAGRALPRGTISVRAAWAFFGGAAIVFIAGCAGIRVLMGNPWPLRLCVPVLAIICVYSYTKRFWRWSHLALGAAIGCAPVAAWIAISPATLGAPAALLLAVVTFWIGGFDVIYACQDVDFDRAHALHSLPARLGVARALWLARLFHFLTVAALIGVGVSAGLGALYYAGTGCVVVLLVIEHTLISPRDLRRVNIAFATINGVVGLVLGTLGVLDVLLS